ncbi:androglobin-like, partial [Cephus cinctus]|uniref:Androglobin-like n=1 Tax=Cephus cinctus TaxID=211228 RepID=A0AAJ7W766_CEPCN
VLRAYLLIFIASFVTQFVRWFVSTMINLQHCGRDGLQVAEESNNFVWLGSALTWQGWLYVYSLNKAGKSAHHRPMFNPHGKYVVRLFYMGFWRRFLIDDMIPVDNGGNVLLPRTGNNFELWPMILSKALLKIASMSWTTNNEVLDFQPVACFTGWIGLSLDTSHLSPMDKWEFLTKYAQHFEWPVQEPDKNTDISTTKKATVSKRAKPRVKSINALENPSPVVLFATLTDMRDVAALNVPGIAPCWSHPVYIELSRDIPLDPTEVIHPLKR